MTKLEIKYRKASELIPYVNNARKHSDEQILKIASSIKEFGFTNPILLDGNNGVIAGHGRLQAAKKLGMEDVPTIDLHGLSEAQKKAYIIADNKIALDSDWDFELLNVEFEALKELDFDLSLTGFDSGFNPLPNFDEASEDEQGRLDEIKTKKCPNCGEVL